MSKSPAKKNVSSESKAPKPVATTNPKIQYLSLPARKVQLPKSRKPIDYSNLDASEPTYQASERVFTLVSQLNEKRTKLRYQIAVCAPTTRNLVDGTIAKKGDSFVKSRGREIALGRLAQKAQSVSLDPDVLAGGHPRMQLALFEHAASNKNLPECARSMFRHFVKELTLASMEYNDHDSARQDAGDEEVWSDGPARAGSEYHFST